MHYMEILQVAVHFPSIEKFCFQAVLLSNLTEVRGLARATGMCKYLMLQFENSVIHLSVSAFYQRCNLFLCLAIALNSNSEICFYTLLSCNELNLFLEYFPEFSRLKTVLFSPNLGVCLPSILELAEGRQDCLHR